MKSFLNNELSCYTLHDYLDESLHQSGTEREAQKLNHLMKDNNESISSNYELWSEAFNERRKLAS